MRSKKSRILRRVIAIVLMAMMTASPMTPIGNVLDFGTGIVASAATYTDEVDAENLQSGDTLKAGANLVCEDYYFQILDENNNGITDETDDWTVDKDYTINSITFDGDEYLYTIHVTSGTSTPTSTPKLAQGLIINSGDTADFTGQWYMIDDHPKYGGWSWGEGVYTITYSYYDPDFGHYCFLLGDVPIVGDSPIYVTSPNIGTDVALKVKGGNGTENSPFTFEVVPASSTGTVYTDNVDVSQLKKGDILQAGACVQGWLTVYDENNNMIVNEEDHWNVYESDGKDYTIKSITYDDFNKEYTIHVTSTTVVNTAEKLMTALAAGGGIKLADDISINQTVTISKECTIDFNGKKIIFGGGRNDEYHLEVNAPTTLKNGTLTSSCTNDPRFAVLNVNSDAVVERMTISQPANKGAHEIVYVGSSKKLTMIDSTITYVQNGTASARAITAEGATLLFYGDNFMNTVNGDSCDWNIMRNCNCYFYSGTLSVNYLAYVYNTSTKVYFCGGAVKNINGGKIFDGLKSADYVILSNGDDDYVIYSDEAYTNPITTAQATRASSIYSKMKSYTVTWQNTDGTLLEKDENITKNTTPSYDGTTPTKESVNGVVYVFAGWNDGTTTYAPNELPAVTADVTYTAVFDSFYPFNLTTSTDGATITVADNNSNAVAITDGSFSGTVGYKITASIPLKFDGATATESVEDSNFIYTITEITADAVTVSNAQVDISDLTITADDQTYTGSALNTVVIMNGTTKLVENTDYTITYDDNINAGKVTATIVCKGRYKGTQTVNFNINKKNFAELDVKFDFDGDSTAYTPNTYSPTANTPSIVYDGKEYTPTAILMLNSTTEVPVDSYDVSITSGKDAGTYTITFTAKDNTNFTGTRTFDWEISKADMTISMTDGLEFRRVGGKVAGECVVESKFAVTGVPEGSKTTFTYFTESDVELKQKPVETGNYKVKATITNKNYNDGTATANFTITSNQFGDWYCSESIDGKSVLIEGYAEDSTDPVIPEMINGLPVTGIYYYAFENSDITSITIPESVDMIYAYAFNNANALTDVYYQGSKTAWDKYVTINSGNNALKNATIHYALPESIYLDQTSIETTPGKSIRLLVSVKPSGTPANFTWESSDEKVATVDEAGNVTTIDFGTATITATADNGKIATCELTVGHNGNNGIFEYTISDDKKVTITKYIGTSDTVDISDKIDDMPIVAIAEGTFAETPLKTINYAGSKTMWEELTTEDLGDITVNYALPTSIKLDATATVTKADTITLTPTVTPKDTATTFTWKSANEEVATVDDKGVVTGVAYGTVNITATADNGKTATCAVTVTNVGEKDDFEYEIVSNDDKDTITITKYNGSDEEVNIPEKINGIPVTVIGAESFKDNATMKDVIILLNVETIEEDAFAGCDSELNIHGYRRTDSERYATENNINFIAIPYPLENNSTISSTNADVNKKVTVTGIGNEGTLSYKYAVYYKSTDSETWIARQSYDKNNVVTLTFEETGTYDICVKVKDTGHNVEKKYFKLTVTQPLANESTISTGVITLGESFKVNMSANGGSGTYKYSVDTKLINETEWTTVSNYSTEETVTVTPDKAGVQNVRINVMDSFGTVNEKYLFVEVKYDAPTNTSIISADTVKLGDTLTVNCAAESGAGSFKYAVYTKSIDASKWTTVQNFAENAEVKTTFNKPGTYQVCAKAMDADGTIVKKYFSVEVTKDSLLNNSTISAKEITIGESIDVNAAANGGFGDYKYAVYYKLSESSKWTTAQNFAENAKVTLTPTKAGRYDICVKVSDETGEIVKRYFAAEVKYEQLVNKCTLSADEINFGEEVIVTAAAENGSGEYKYAVYMKSTSRTAWTTVQDFSEQTEIKVTFKNKGSYDICTKVMDSDGTIAKSYTSVYVK